MFVIEVCFQSSSVVDFKVKVKIRSRLLSINSILYFKNMCVTVSHPSSPQDFSEVHVLQSLVICVVFCRQLFVFNFV
jgi:hypothetical protein